MTMFWLPASLSPWLPQHCTPTSPLLINISAVFHTCIPTPLALLSTILGICSIVAWLFAQLPQIFKNFALKSASGLSVLFLIEWLLGDATNLVGGVLTKQATWQILIAGYYVTVDLVILSQYLWYTHFRSRQTLQLDESKSSSLSGDGDDLMQGPPRLLSRHGSYTVERTRESETKDGRGEIEETHNRDCHQDRSQQSYLERYLPDILAAKAADQKTGTIRKSPSAHTVSGKGLLLTSALCAVAVDASPVHKANWSQPTGVHATDALMITGQVTSWVCTLLYLGSRVPQIYKNQRRRSTSGLSPALFISAFCGNLFYSSSLLANPLAWSSYGPHGHHGWAGSDGSDRATWLSLAAPFWLGAFGVLALDAVIGVQFLQFGEGSAGKTMAVVRTGRRKGRRWPRVSGWMRGWMPSLGPKSRGSDVEEAEQRLLLQHATGPNSRYDAA